MPDKIEYYFSPISGYAYLGHKALLTIARETHAEIGYYPIDIRRIFTASGTTPPAKQAESRKSYRNEDMGRYATMHQLPLNLKPKFWPASSTLACKAIIASRYLGLNQGDVSNAILTGVWALDADISDTESLKDLLNNASLPGLRILDCCDVREVNEDYECFTSTAVEKGIFGSPTYVLDDERFWGQDRLPILRQRLDLQHAKPLLV